MPTERESTSNVNPPKLEVVRLEDRLNPVGVPTTEALLSFNPNPVLDLGVSTPTVPLGTAADTSTTAAPAPADAALAPNLYEQVLPDAAVPPSADSSGGSFALFSIVPPPPAASLSGYVYVDEGAGGGTRDDGIKQPGEPGIPGATLTLLRVINGVTISASATTTDATGFYQFPDLTPFGEYRVVETQPAGFLDGKDTAGTINGATRGTAGNDIISGVTLNPLDNGINYNFGELVPVQFGSLSGFVYVDEGAGGGTRDDGVKQPGEAPIPGTAVTLFRVVNGQTVSVAQTTTDGTGFYRFTNLPAGGGYVVRETQPAGFNDGKDTPGTTGGNNSVNDELSGITVPANGESFNNNFGELIPPPIPARLSGFVYEDLDDDGIKDPGEPGIAGVTVGITGQLPNGQLFPPALTTTDANGFYEFNNLPPGTYVVSESQPAAYLDGRDTPGSTGGSNSANDVLSAIPLAAGANSQNNNFGERRGSISGFVYADEGANGGTRDDGIKQPGEPGIGGVTVRLLRNGVPQATTFTATDGSYRFDGLFLGGGYTVEEVVQPAGFLDGKDTAGVPGGGTAGNEVISNITLTQSAPISPNNNFGELLPPPALATLSGFVYVDEGAGGGTRDDGVKQPGEAPIPGTAVTLFRVVNGQTVSVAQTTTDGTGFYQFAGLEAGTYEVRESQPAGFEDGKDTPGTTGGVAPQNDRLLSIPLAAGANSQNNNFGELLPRGALSGFVYLDDGRGTGVGVDDGVKQANELGIQAATVTLFRVVNGQTTSLSQTVTDGLGFYRFTNLPAGGGYVVRETQPTGFLDGKDTIGSTGGVVANDELSAITVPANGESINNNFGELLPPPPPPARLSGFVYLDDGRGTGVGVDDGIKQANELGIQAVAVTLFRVVNGITTSVAQTVTDGLGFYEFVNLPAGTYVVRETQPAAFLDGKDTAGSTGGVVTNDQIAAIPLVAGANSVNNNFGELLPPPPPPLGALSGFVYEDTNDNGLKEAGEAGIPGVTVRLFGGTAVLTATTDAAGFYQFTSLTAGQYTVVENQPAAYLDGKDTPGSTGGSNTFNDYLVAVNVPAGVTSVNNNFGELKPVSLFGHVWFDENRSATFDRSEIGLGGATVTLTGVTFGGRTVSTAVTTTDQAGRYAFTGLLPGVYRTVQTNTPAGYTDFASENAAGLIVGGSTPTEFAGIPLTRDSGPLNFGKVLENIVVPPPPTSPQVPLPPSKIDFLGSTGRGGVTTTGSTTAAILPAGTGTADAAPVAPRLYAVGSAAGSVATVSVFDAASGSERFRFQPFDSFTGGVTTAIGDVNADGIDDVLAGAAAGGGPRVKAFDGRTGGVIADFYAYAPDFTGGVWLASGDVDGDGYDDIVTGSGSGASHVRAFSGRTLGEIASFYAFDPGTNGGVRVAAGDFNGDGRADIAAGSGAGGVSQIASFDGRTLGVLSRHQPFESSFLGGVNLAAGDVNGDGIAEVIAGAASGGPRVKVMNATSGATVYDFYAFDPSLNGGVSVASRDLNGDGRADIIAGSGAGQQARVSVFSGANLGTINTPFAFESAGRNGIYVG